MPELENLIAMSRIFGVTIGTLLGVEPPAEEPGQGEPVPPEAGGDAGEPENTAPSPAGELTERELAAAEAIAEKYLAAAQTHPRRSRRRKIALGAAACVLVLALVLSGALLWGQLLEIRQELASVKAYTYQQTQSVGGNTDTIISESDTIFHDFTIWVTNYDLETQTLTLGASVQAKAWEADTTCAFTAILSDGQQFQAEALRQEGTCSVEDWVLPMGDEEIRFFATLTTAGASASQPIGFLACCLPEDFQLDIAGYWDTARHSGIDPLRLELDDLRLRIRYPDVYPATSVFHAPTGLDLCFYRNESTTPELVLPMEEVLAGLTQTQSADLVDDPDYRASFDLAPEDTLVSALRIRDDHGDTRWYITGTFQNRGGTLLSRTFPDQTWDSWQPGSLPQP